jgi:two-component sensor histidine kinase
MPPDIWNVTNLHRAIDAAGVALWAWNVDTDLLELDATAYDLWAVPKTDRVAFEDLSSRIHPADRDRVGAAFAATRGVVGSYEIDFRVLIEDAVRWVSARGQGGDEGMVDRMMFGIFLDVTGRKQAEESQELLAGEMSHRVKNLLTIATGLTTITSRSAESTKDMAAQLTRRLTALGRAHDLVRPLPGHQGSAALLGDLLSVLLAPYDDLGAFSGRIRVSVPRTGIGESAANSLALVIHELATNSLKYGALSAKDGTLDISGAVEGDILTFAWLERGGPPVSRPSGPAGYGTTLVERAVRRQLGGSIAYDWSSDGAIVNMTFNVARLVD